MCQERDEDIDHLFFEFHVNAEICTRLQAWQGIYRPIFKCQEEVQWKVGHMKERSNKMQVYRMTLANTIYYSWKNGIEEFSNEARANGEHD